MNGDSEVGIEQSDQMGPPRTLGILGGMGPLATARFYRRFVERTVADRDQDHHRVIMLVEPRIPDRTEFLLDPGADDPLPLLIEGAASLKSVGADLVVMPCNTASVFKSDIEKAAEIAVFDWVGSAAEAVAKLGVSRVGILATSGTIASRIYQQEFARRNTEAIVPETDLQQVIMQAIYGSEGVKTLSAASAVAAEMLQTAIDKLVLMGAGAILVGCTELPLLIDVPEVTVPVPLVDPGDEAITAILDWFAKDGSEPPVSMPPSALAAPS